MANPIKKGETKEVNTDKKISTGKNATDKKQLVDKNYRPRGSNKQIGDGSAGMGGTSAI